VHVGGVLGPLIAGYTYEISSQLMAGLFYAPTLTLAAIIYCPLRG
jgi:hypothetical protein